MVRIALMLVGALVMSSGLVYLLTLQDVMRTSVEQGVEKSWRASYDILVRPPTSVTDLERKYDLLEPNALVALAGGITVEQWEDIKRLEDVEIAAPIASVGLTDVFYLVPWGRLDSPGLYRVTETVRVDDGLGGKPASFVSYVYRGADAGGYTQAESRQLLGAGISDWGSPGKILATPSSGGLVSVAAIDPEQEAKLVGLDESVVWGRSLAASDSSKGFTSSVGYTTEIPVLASDIPYIRESCSITVEKLPVPSDNLPAYLTSRGGAAYLKTLSGEIEERRSLSPEQLHAIRLDALGRGRNEVNSSQPLFSVPGPAVYREIAANDLREKWPTILEVVPQGATAFVPDSGPVEGWVSWRQTPPQASSARVGLRIVGLFDPAKLKMTIDPTNELPMETYRSPTAIQRLDENKNPVQPPPLILPTDVAHGLFTGPPILLTTIQAVESLRGGAPIAAIRVRVRGVSEATEESQRKLEKVAAEITKKTGLRAEITAGSSPRRVLIHVPGWEGDVEAKSLAQMRAGAAGATVHLSIPGQGYLEQPWVQKGAGIGLIRETRVGKSLLVFAILVTGILFVLANTFISAEGWRKEASLLAGLGARPRSILALVIGESLLFAAVVTVVGLLLLAATSGIWSDTVSRVLAIVGLPMLVYGLGSVPGALALVRTPPSQGLRSAGTDSYTPRFACGPTVPGQVLALLGTRPWRSLLSVAALAMPATLAGAFTYISLRLRGELFLTWLGHSLTMRIGPAHYLTLFLVGAIAVISTVDLIWVEIEERSREFALLGALGVPPSAVRLAISGEGALLGLCGGVIGAVVAVILVRTFYSSAPHGLAVIWEAAISVPFLSGLVAAQFPAIAVQRSVPAYALREE